MLPFGGYVTIEVEAYFDESGSHDGAPVLCVAGYIFKKSEAIKLRREWRKVLRWKELPYFRMSECAHGNGPFANLTKPERVEVETKLIEIIKARSIQGLAVTVNSKEFLELMPRHNLIGGPYTFSAHAILGGIYNWLQCNPRVGRMAYFFEAGHKNEREANAIMKLLFEQPKLKEAYKFGRYGFVDKEGTPAVQAADLLAWQWYTDKRHQLEGRPRRMDCVSLLEHHHNAIHIGPDKIIELARRFGFGSDDPTLLNELHLGDDP